MIFKLPYVPLKFLLEMKLFLKYLKILKIPLQLNPNPYVKLIQNSTPVSIAAPASTTSSLSPQHLTTSSPCSHQSGESSEQQHPPDIWLSNSTQIAKPIPRKPPRRVRSKSGYFPTFWLLSIAFPVFHIFPCFPLFSRDFYNFSYFQ